MKKLEILHTALCNSDELVYSGLRVVTKKGTKEKFPTEDFETREDYWLRVIKGGGSIWLMDMEGMEEPAEISKSILKERFKTLKDNTYFQDLVTAFKQEQDDAFTAMDFIQFIALGEVVYG